MAKLGRSTGAVRYRDKQTGRFVNKNVAAAAFIYDQDSSLGEKLATDPMVAQYLTRVAKEIKKKARANTPHLTGQMRRSIFQYEARIFDISGDGPIPPGARYGAIVTSWSRLWHVIEYGSINNPPFRPITRAAQDVTGNFFEAPYGEDLQIKGGSAG